MSFLKRRSVRQIKLNSKTVNSTYHGCWELSQKCMSLLFKGKITSFWHPQPTELGSWWGAGVAGEKPGEQCCGPAPAASETWAETTDWYIFYLLWGNLLCHQIWQCKGYSASSFQSRALTWPWLWRINLPSWDTKCGCIFFLSFCIVLPTDVYHGVAKFCTPEVFTPELKDSPVASVAGRSWMTFLWMHFYLSSSLSFVQPIDALGPFFFLNCDISQVSGWASRS